MSSYSVQEILKKVAFSLWGKQWYFPNLHIFGNFRALCAVYYITIYSVYHEANDCVNGFARDFVDFTTSESTATHVSLLYLQIFLLKDGRTCFPS